MRNHRGKRSPQKKTRSAQSSSNEALVVAETKRLLRQLHFAERLKQTGGIILGTKDDGETLAIKREHLETHVLIMGATGHGKTKLVQQIVRELAPQAAEGALSLLIDDPKSDFQPALLEDFAAMKLERSVTFLDTSNLARTPSVRMWNDALTPEENALWFLEILLACMNQRSYDETPQRPRWTYNAAVPTVAAGGDIQDMLMMLSWSGAGRRSELLSHTTNQLVHQEWRDWQAMKPHIRRQETYSAMGWLFRLWQSREVRHIFHTHPEAFDFGKFLRTGGIFPMTVPRYRNTNREAVQFIRSSILQLAVSHALAIPPDKRPPLLLVLDEAEHALERDTGLIDMILSEGRSLGIHLILLFHHWEQVRRGNPALLASVMTNCRCKIAGGRLNVADLRLLAEDAFIEEWHDQIVRFQSIALELDPILTWKEQHSFSEGAQETRGTVVGTALSEALANGLSFGESVTEGEVNTLGHTQSSQKSQGVHGAEAVHTADMASAGEGYVYNGFGIPIPLRRTTNQSNSHTDGRTLNSGFSEATSEGDAWNSSQSSIRMVSYSAAMSIMKTLSETLSRSESMNSGTSTQRGVTLVPFYEYIKRYRVASREFLSLDDFLIGKLIKIRKLKQAGWFILLPYQKARFFSTRWINELPGGKERLPIFDAAVLGQACYARDPSDSLRVVVEKQLLIPEVLTPMEREEDREDREPTNEDFAQPIPPSLL